MFHQIIGYKDTNFFCIFLSLGVVVCAWPCCCSSFNYLNITNTNSRLEKSSLPFVLTNELVLFHLRNTHFRYHKTEIKLIKKKTPACLVLPCI
jgi:hypothetical protein